MTTFVLVHGAWHGGWCWQRVAWLLRVAGHDVYTPTLTGLGERAHLLGPEIRLHTHVQDIVGVLEYEDLRDVVLVGHSYSGMVITGVAEQAAERLRHLVYLDAFVPVDGQSMNDLLAPEVVTVFNEQARLEGNGYGIPPLSDSFGITAADDLAWVRARLGMHPLNTHLDPVQLSNQLAHRLPRTYLYCGGPILKAVADRLRSDPDWHVLDFETGHDAMVTEPEALSRLLGDLAAVAHPNQRK